MLPLCMLARACSRAGSLARRTASPLESYHVSVIVDQMTLATRKPSDRLPVDPDVRELVAGAGRMPHEVVSLWPSRDRARVLVWIGRDETGRSRVRARPRAHDLDPPDLAREVRRVRGDTAVIIELGGDRKVVVPLKSIAGDLDLMVADRDPR